MKKSSIIYVLIGLLFSVLLAQDNTARLNRTELLRLATQYERRGQYQMAAEYYARVSMKNPDELAGYLGAKRCFYQLTHYDQFIEFVKKLQTQKRHLRYQVDIADAIYRQGDRKQAFELWQRVLDENQEVKQAYELIGLALMQLQQLDKAKAVFQKARTVFKNKSLYIHELAAIYANQQDFDRVAREYLHLLQIDSNQQAYIESRFLSYCEEPQISQKIATALKKQLKQFQSLESSIRSILANILMVADDYEGALEQHLVLEKESDEKGRHLFRFAQTAAKQDQAVYARRAYQLIIDRYSNSAYYIPSQHGLAKIYDDQGDYEQALHAYKQFSRAFAQSSQAIQVLLRMGDIYLNVFFAADTAKTYYQKVIKKWPGTRYYHTAFFQLGKCYIVEGNLQRAEDIYRDFAEKKHGDTYYHQAMWTLAKINMYRGQPFESIDTLGKMIKKDSDLSDKVINDVLRLFMLIKENQTDSLSLVHYGRVLYSIQRRKYNEGLEIIEEELKKDNTLKDEFQFLAVSIYRILGEPQKAIQRLETIVADENSIYRDRASYLMAQLYDRELQEQEKAIALYETILEKYPKSIYIERVRKRIRDIRG